jgi:hypothetical protein
MATIAASLLLLLTVVSLSQFSKPWVQQVSSEQSVATHNENSTDQSEPAGDAIIAMIVRDSQRARLQATIEILESQPALQDRVEMLRQQLADVNRW